jgi:3',5'-cyclic AMP phosphodiesterase CpdA
MGKPRLRRDSKAMASGSLNRRNFCQTVVAGMGGLLLPSVVGGADPQAAAAPPADPLLYQPGSFTLAVLPDTQYYCESYPHHFYNQTKWIVENGDSQNIKFMLHLGDITNRNTPEQWDVAQRAITALDGHVPYALVAGNHDYGPGGNAVNRDTSLNDYFPLSRQSHRPTFGGAMEDGRLENTFHTFQAGKHDYLILALEWGPRDKVVDWANQVVTDHPRHRAILITHAYMYFDDNRYDWAKHNTRQQWNPHSYGTAPLPGGTNDGEQLWQKLVSKHPNFILTLNGHVLDDGLARLTSQATDGHDVHQMLVNYQMKHEGGEGYMRLIRFLPDDETIHVTAYSPSLDRYKTDPDNQFVLQSKMPLS